MTKDILFVITMYYACFSPVDVGRISSSTKLSQQLSSLCAVHSNESTLYKMEETERIKQ